MNSILEFQTGNTLHPTNSVYVQRPEDTDFLAAATSSSWINVYGCRTMGKSSLYVKHSAELRRRGITLVAIDISSEVDAKASYRAWFRQLGRVIAKRIHLAPSSIASTMDHLPDDTAPGTVAESLFAKIMGRVSGRLLIVLDEYDSIATDLSFSDQILRALRHVQELQQTSRTFERLSICLIGLRPIYELATPGDPSKSIACTRIVVRDFDANETTFAAFRRGFPHTALPDDSVLRQVLTLSGGQPLVTTTLLKEVLKHNCRTATDVTTAAFRLVGQSGIGSDIPLFETIDTDLASMGSDAFAALRTYDSILKGKDNAPTASGASLLLLYGLVRAEETRLLPKGELFARRFDGAWVERALSRAARGAAMQQYRGSSSVNEKHICVINTGGTLGMVQRGGRVVPTRNEDEFKAYFSSLKSIAKTVEFHNLFVARDSINIFPDHWITIAEFIYRRRNAGFDGFVVAHGTDTMAYTASAVAFALGRHLSFPVVFTGAQTTPDVAFGDAHVNLYRACEVAKQPIPEVVISFGNFVYRAVRAQKKDDRRFDGFESPTYPPLAEITGEINVRTEVLRKSPRVKRDIALRADFERSILIVPQFPGLEPDFFERLLVRNDGLPNCKGVIVQTLGAGNVTSEAPYSFIPFVKRAYASGIPVIVTSQYPPDPGTHTKYTPAQAPIKAGAIHAGNMTLAAAVTKFRWVLANVRLRRGWPTLSPDARKALVQKLMVEEQIIGEF